MKISVQKIHNITANFIQIQKMYKFTWANMCASLHKINIYSQKKPISSIFCGHLHNIIREKLKKKLVISVSIVKNW